MVPIFQIRKLRLRDLVKVTQLKGCGAKAQTPGISPHSVLLSPSRWGRAGIGHSDRGKGPWVSPAISKADTPYSDLSLEKTAFCFLSSLLKFIPVKDLIPVEAVCF